MDEKIRKSLARLANHLDLGGFSKFADEVDEAIMEMAESDEDYLEPQAAGISNLEIALLSKSICESIQEMIASYGGDYSEIISDLTYEDMESGMTMLDDMIFEELSSLGQMDEEELLEAIEAVKSSYDFVGHLEDDSFEDLCEEIEEDILELEQWKSY